MLSITAVAGPIFIKAGETMELPIGSDQEVKATFYLDQVEVYKNETLTYNHSWFYTPNISAIGYHNLTTLIENVNGSSVTQMEIFVGTMFAVKNETVGGINATTESILAEPNKYYDLATFVENSIGIYRAIGEMPKVEFAGSKNIFNLTTIVETGIKDTNPIPMDNGTKYLFSFNTSNKNGTFLFSLGRPYAETPEPERRKINVTVIVGQVKISPRSDVNGNFQKGDIQDLTTIRRYLNKSASYCPRCDVDYSNFINMDDYNQTVAQKGPVITV